ncbi:MAG: esterase family protein [Ardenticatenales bacterium]|nr:esterase family protein [Ardenticatenales bacterium]
MPPFLLPDIYLLVGCLGGLLLLQAWQARRRAAQRRARVRQVTLPHFASAYLGNSRDLFVFLPPGYDNNQQRRYPVLYVNDGQDREQLRLRETLADLMLAGRIRPLIAVAIPTNADRLQEYGTAAAANAQGLGTRAADYARFVVEEVMPAINTQFRTHPHSAAILGASLGGLSAFDIAWNHPRHFGIVGVFSGSFWWRAAPAETAVTPNALIMHDVVRHGAPRPALRGWFEAGTRDERDDRDQNGVIDAIQDTLELIAAWEEKGGQVGQNIAYVEIRGGKHNYETWSRALPEFLTWAF